MRKTLSSLLLLTSSLLFAPPPIAAQGTYQLKNAGFEEWESVSYTTKINGEEPKYWNSFLTGTGKFKGVAVKKSQLSKSEDVRSGANGKYSAKIIDYKVSYGVITAYANGNLTTGCINMGSVTASDASGNYNFTDTSDDNFNQKFTGLPDAMSVWVKYYSSNSSYRAKASTILHLNGYYQDPYCNQNDIVEAVATATDENIQPNDTWTELTIPFVYSKTDGTRPAYALVSFSTNAKPGTGTGNDYLLIDDLEYVYYHTLKALSYGGTDILEDGKTEYDLTDQTFDESKLSYAKKAQGGTVEQSFVEGTDYDVVTLTVKGDNYEADNTSVTIYTLKFKKKSKTYDENLVISVNGESTDDIPAKIQVVHMSNGTINFSLKNFYIPSESDDEGSEEESAPMYVGNITLTGVTVAQADGYETIATDQKITIEEGTEPEDANWFGPYLGEIPVKLSGKLTDDKLYVNIDIDMQESIEQIINVAVGADFTNPVEIGTASTVNCEAQKAWVNFHRSFKQGWNTLVLPFATTAEELGAEKVATLSSGTDNTAYFTVSDDGAVAANVPYVVYFEAAAEAKINKLVRLSATSDVKSVTPDGSALTFVGNYTAARSLYDDGTSLGYGLVNANGKSTIRPAGSGATVPATAAYFTVGASNSGTKAFSVVFEGNDVTGIDGHYIVNDGKLTSASRGVYTLQGVKVSNGSTQGLPAGLYIVDGKKMLVR